MYCPEHILINNRWLFVMHWQRADIRRQYVTWAEVLNPLRYEINVRMGGKIRLTLNDDAWLNRSFSNITWWLWRRRLWERTNSKRGGQ